MAYQSLDTSLLSYDRLHERGLTLKGIAAQLGTHPETVGAWRSGDSNPAPENQRKLAAILGVSVERLMSGRRDGWTMAKAHRAAQMLVCADDDGLSEMSPVRKRIELRRRRDPHYYAVCGDMP